MNAHQQRVANSIDNSLVSLSNLRAMPPAVAHNYEELRTAFQEVRKHSTEQTIARNTLGVHGRSLAQTRRDLRQKHLLPIVSRGKVLLKGLPGIQDELRLPRVRASDAEWLAAAKRVAKAVRPHRKVFLEARFAPDFLQRLDDAARALQVKSRSENAAVERRAVETRALAASLRHCRELVASIDSLVMASDDIDPVWLIGWRHSKRIPKRVGRPPRKKAARDRRVLTQTS